MAHPVIHWEIGARDADRLQSFYTELFGWDIAPAGPGYSIVAPEDGGIGGGIMQVKDPVPPYLTFYVEVDDLEAEVQRSTDLGATQVVPPTAIPGVGRFAMFRDPDGNHIGMLETGPGQG